MDENEKVVLQIVEANTVTIPREEYLDLVERATKLDMIGENIRQNVAKGRYSKINEDVVMLLTGMTEFLMHDKPEATDE